MIWEKSFLKINVNSMFIQKESKHSNDGVYVRERQLFFLISARVSLRQQIVGCGCISTVVANVVTRTYLSVRSKGREKEKDFGSL